MASNFITFIPSMVKIVQLVKKFKGRKDMQADRLHAELRNIFSVFKKGK
jgi:hypothetical protein